VSVIAVLTVLQDEELIRCELFEVQRALKFGRLLIGQISRRVNP